MQVNSQAPDFVLSSQSGELVRLSDFIGKKIIVIYFYPADFTPGCTAESCAFRDVYENFRDAGAEVIGISTDDLESHRKFAQKHQLPFILLSDSQGEVRKLYQVPATLGILPGRVTYVIDKKGIIRLIFNSQLNTGKHIAEALRMLEHLQKEDKG